MPIEFYCPGCGNLMRTPDETAGRKGRCPTCQLKVQIPAKSVAASSSEAAIPRSAIAATPKGNEPIRFDCGSCGKTLSIAAANAGKKGKCPHCGELMSIPLKSPAAGERWKGTPKQRPTPAPARSPTPAPAPQSAPMKPSGDKIEFPCSNCHEVVRVGVAAAGKKGQCPRCKAVIQIPLNSTSASGLQPIPKNKPTSPRPQSKPAATTSGLTPLPSVVPASAGLTPLDDSGLSPLDPLGLTPLGPVGSGVLGDDLFGIDSLGPTQVDDGNPFGAASDKYSVPRPTPVVPLRSRRGNRTGAEITTMICGATLSIYGLAQLVSILVSMVKGWGLFYAPPEWQARLEGDPGLATMYLAGKIIAALMFGAATCTILAGGIQMVRLKVWGLCLAACILTILPYNGCCLLGIPIGIWGTIMLSLSQVRSAFR